MHRISFKRPASRSQSPRHLGTSHVVDAPSPFRPAELFWLCGALCLLWFLAHPMSTSGATSGLDGRYAVPAAELPPRAQVRAIDVPDVEATARLQQRSTWLHGHLALYVTMLAATGWVALLLGRSRLPLTTRLGLIGPLWCATGVCLGARGWAASGWLELGVGWATIALAIAVSRRALVGRQPPSPTQTAASVWRYPGFVLLSGVGLIWITDLAARGPVKQLFIGVRQADHLLTAYATLTMVAASAPMLLAACARGASLLEARYEHRSVWIRAVFTLGLPVLALSILTVLLRAGVIQASAFGEMARVLFWLVSGWLMYRWVDRDYPSGASLLLLLASQAILLIAYVVNDKGQAMVMLLSLCVPFAVLIAPMMLAAARGRPSSRLVRVGLSCLMWLPAAGSVVASVWTFGPRFGPHIAERLEALSSPFTAENDFLAQLFWLSHASGLAGFGLTHVPWCGYLGSIGGVCRGIPEQIQSDYVVQGLAAVWGMPVATLLVLGLCAWLVAMPRLNPGSAGRARSLLALRAWLLAFFCVSVVTQVFVSSLGALGSLPLTGVPLPLLAYGQTGLVVASAFVGLAMHRWVEGELSSRPLRGSSHV